ncbi:hypothetical protein CYD30_14505 [Kosakonia cowanii]|nr:hypothetical protein CYD30_14505 [Kosakonia cowanii]
MAASSASISTCTSRLAVSSYSLTVFMLSPHGCVLSLSIDARKKVTLTSRAASLRVLIYTGVNVTGGVIMKVNDRVTVKTDGGPRRPGVVLAVEAFNEGTMYLVSLEDYPLGIWFFNEKDHPDGVFVELAE